MSYERDCTAEAGSGLEVTEEIAYKLSGTTLNLEIYDTNKETSEETLVDTVKIDISCLLFQERELNMTWNFNKLKPLALNYLNLTIKCDKPLLSDFYRKKLNPL